MKPKLSFTFSDSLHSFVIWNPPKWRQGLGATVIEGDVRGGVPMICPAVLSAPSSGWGHGAGVELRAVCWEQGVGSGTAHPPQVSDATGQMNLTKVADSSPFALELLLSDDCFVLDNGLCGKIYIWKGTCGFSMLAQHRCSCSELGTLPVGGLGLPDCFQNQPQGDPEGFLCAVLGPPKFQAMVLKLKHALESLEGLLKQMATRLHPLSLDI